MMLAEGSSTPDGPFLLQFVLCLSLLGNLVLLALNVANARRTQKREVSFTGECADKEHFDKHVTANEKEHLRLHGRISEAKDELHDKINKVDREVAGLSEINKLQTQHILRTEGKIDRLLERKE